MVKALIIDDNPSNCMVTEFILDELGVASASCGSGAEGIQLLQTQSFDVVFLDWMMPGMDGIQFLQQLQSRNLLDKQKIIMCTAKALETDRQTAMSEGAHAFLSKPITLESVAQALQSLNFSVAPL